MALGTAHFLTMKKFVALAPIATFQLRDLWLFLIRCTCIGVFLYPWQTKAVQWNGTRSRRLFREHADGCSDRSRILFEPDLNLCDNRRIGFPTLEFKRPSVVGFLCGINVNHKSAWVII